jgi:hypothetical protein
MSFVRVRIPGVGEWSQEADKPLREDVGEELVPDSEHDVRYADAPEPPNETPPAEAPTPAAKPGRSRRRQTSEGN